MEEMFRIDLKDYTEEDEKKITRRPSARAVVVRDGKVLLIYSPKYQYYKFPGGGIEAGESNEEALIREVQEETGFIVIPASIREYGYVHRKQKDRKQETGIFVQDNLYYFCEIEEKTGPTKLDDYEREEGFTVQWMTPLEASEFNRYNASPDCDRIMVKRETKVLDMLDLHLRKEVRAAHEREAIAELGNRDYAAMLSFVEKELTEDCAENMDFKIEIDYSRFDHIKRVLKWAKKLYDESSCKEKLKYDDIMIATIFHDVGRKIEVETGEHHAYAGAAITKKYLLEHGYSEERAEYISWLVYHHSDKELMRRDNTESIDKNLLLLMEADLLDDMGALGVVMDCMIVKGRNPRARFEDCLDHISRYTMRIQHDNPMVTAEGRRIWDEKTRLVDEFVRALRYDIEL